MGGPRPTAGGGSQLALSIFTAASAAVHHPKWDTNMPIDQLVESHGTRKKSQGQNKPVAIEFHAPHFTLSSFPVFPRLPYFTR